MALFTFKTTANDTYFIGADTRSLARTRLLTAFPSKVITNVKLIVGADYSLLTSGGSLKWIIQSQAGNYYYVDGATDDAAITTWSTNNSSEFFYRIDQVVGANFTLLSTTPTPPVTGVRDFGINVHFGQGGAGTPNADYSASTIPLAIQAIKAMHMNSVRCSTNMSNAGIVYQPAWSPFVSACVQNGIKGCVIFGLTGRGGAPAAGGNLFTQPEYTNYYNLAVTRMTGFLNANPGFVSRIQIGNENEIFVADLAPTSPPGNLTLVPAGPTGAGNTGSPYRWPFPSNGWKQINYGAYLYFCIGLYDAAKAFDPTIKVGMNYAARHPGLLVRFATDFINITVNGTSGRKLDFMGQDWYNLEEYGSNRAMQGTAISDIKARFKTSNLVTEVGLTETGFDYTKNNPDNKTKFTFWKYMYDTYVTLPDCSFVYYYELFMEVKARASAPGEASLGIQDYRNAILSDDVNNVGAQLPPIAL